MHSIEWLCYVAVDSTDSITVVWDPNDDDAKTNPARRCLDTTVSLSY